MAKISWIVPVNRVLKNENNDMVLDSPITQLGLRVLPNNYSFNVAFGIIDLDILKENTVKFIMGTQIDGNKHILINTYLNLDTPMTGIDNEIIENNSVEFDSSININNFDFEHEGLHFIRLEIDDNSMESYFNVVIKGV